MKIGIYTFFRSNYGATLQAYSLQKTIKQLFPEDEVLIVDFKTEHHQPYSKIFRRWSNNTLYNTIWQFHIICHWKQLKRKIKSFNEFKEEFKYTDYYLSKEELLSNPPKVDVHLSGSDQVFNPKNPDKDVYYLNFKKDSNRKIAYAPSFGVNIFSDEDKEYIKHTLSDFDYLSCRELNGAEFLTSLLGVEVPHLLDPVFLTSTKEWREIEVPPNIRQKYVFVYCLRDTKCVLKYAKQKYPGMLIVLLTPNDLRFYSGCKRVFYPGPREFLGLIDSADVVITDSFHGTAFSIIFGKEFRTIITRPQISSRIYSLLSSIGCEGNIVSTDTTINSRPEPFNGTIKQMIDISINYLSRAIHPDGIGQYKTTN